MAREASVLVEREHDMRAKARMNKETRLLPHQDFTPGRADGLMMMTGGFVNAWKSIDNLVDKVVVSPTKVVVDNTVKIGHTTLGGGLGSLAKMVNEASGKAKKDRAAITVQAAIRRWTARAKARARIKMEQRNRSPFGFVAQLMSVASKPAFGGMFLLATLTGAFVGTVEQQLAIRP